MKAHRNNLAATLGNDIISNNVLCPIVPPLGQHIWLNGGNQINRGRRVELDNNSVKRAIRPQTITRKNALFAGSEAGGETWATIASLLATARLNDVDPSAWLTQTLERIAAGWPNKNIDALLPWNFSRD